MGDSFAVRFFQGAFRWPIHGWSDQADSDSGASHACCWVGGYAGLSLGGFAEDSWMFDAAANECPPLAFIQRLAFSSTAFNNALSAAGGAQNASGQELLARAGSGAVGRT
eukprot:8949625-Pyramimonas_sp.AAC.1